MNKLPIGTIVDYHGSLTYMHGQYEVEGYSDLDQKRAWYGADEVNAHYPHGFAYNLWSVGVPKKFGFRDQSILDVRPESVTVVSSDDGAGLAST